MKATLILTSLVLAVLLFGGCATSPGTDTNQELSSYACPKCKETVTWSYRGSKPSATLMKKKMVSHECPSCKRTWDANLSIGSTCSACLDEHLQCPACRKHG